MHDDTTRTTTRRRTGPRIASAVAGTVAGLLAVGFLAAGGGLLYGDAQKDDDGYFTTASEPFATSTYALATDNLDVDLEGAGWIMDRDDVGNVRLEVKPRDGKPVFVGIAPTADVSTYLGGTSHTSVTDVEYSPFNASYQDRGGDRRPGLPAEQRFWEASAHGAGAQTLTWDLEDGDWSVVVMNEDASRTVDASITAGAKVPFLATAGWVSIGGGVLLLVVAGAAFVLGVRRPGDRGTAAQDPPAVPAPA